MRKPFNSSFARTQGFGENPAIYSRFGMKGHNGHDYALPTGTPVLAPHDGKVVEATNDPTGYGNYLKVESDIEGSVLAHLQKFAVSVGQDVKEGQVIGYSDNTGFSTGAHLHWGYYRIPRNRQNGYAGFVDQTPFIGTVTSSPTPPTTMDKRQPEFDEAHLRLRKYKYAPDGSGHEYWFSNPADPHKFANQIEALALKVEELKKGDPNAQAKIQQAKEEGYKSGYEDGKKKIKDEVAKL